MSAKRVFILLPCLVLSFFYCSGQSTLTGTVTGQNAAAIPYATVSLSDVAGKSSVVQADTAGRFMFKNLITRTYRVKIYSLGYGMVDSTIRIDRDTVIHISLKPLKGSLKGVTVRADKPFIERKPDRVIYHLAGNVTAAGADGLEALSKAPGIKINNNIISLAGKGLVSVMVNDRLLHLSGEELTRYLKSMSAGQIDKIEIITHPSARYDASGGGGLINIITKQNKQPGLSGDIQGSLMRFLFTNPPDYGVPVYGYGTGSANLNYNAPKWSAYGNVTYNRGRELEGYGIEIDYPKQHWAMGDTGDYKHSTINFLAGADYKINTHTTVGFQYTFGKEVYQGADYVHNPIYNIGGGVDSILRSFATYYPIALSNSLNLHFINDLGTNGQKLTVDADYFNYYRTDLSSFRTNTYSGEGKLIPGSETRYKDTTKQNILVYTLKADLELPTPFAKFMVGGKLSFIDNYSNIYYYKNDSLTLNHALSNEFRYNENTQALYASAIKAIGSWKLQAGLRTELTQTTGISYFLNRKTRHTYLKLFPSVLVSYKADEKNNLSLSYGKRINRPTFWNLNPYISLMTAYSYVEGNPSLQPEYITNMALTHTFKELLTSSVYVNVINNGFTSITRANADSNYIHTMPLNFIKTLRYGISESLSLTPLRGLESTVQVNAYYTRAHSSLPYINGITGFGLYVATNNTLTLNKAGTLKGAANFWCQFPEVDHIGRSNTYYKLDLGLMVFTLHKKLSIALNGSDLLQSSGSVVHTTVQDLHETFTNFQVFSNIKLSASWHFGNNKVKRKPISTGNEAERARIN
jgi:hypothetical protein